MTKTFQAYPFEIDLFLKRAQFFNNIVGALSFSLALGSLGTGSPRFYGTISLMFVIMIMGSYGKQFERVYQIWREQNHPLIQVRVVWRAFKICLFGLTMLVAVALGGLTQNGVLGF